MTSERTTSTLTREFFQEQKYVTVWYHFKRIGKYDEVVMVTA